MSTRFTAVIKIVKVEETPAVTGRYSNQPDISPAKREDTELANIVVRNTDLASLLTKTKAHLDLVEE
jgi:hypothetical protein